MTAIKSGSQYFSSQPRNFEKVKSFKLCQMKGLGELLSYLTIRTGSVNSTFCSRALTVTAILTVFEAVAGTKIA